jgi:tripartite-type tricarboxylate transporter receptor subunit TctC
LRALALSTAKRSAIAPDIPTLDESGIKGYEAKSWNSLVVPRRTPAAIVQRLNSEVTAVLNMPQLADQLKSQGIEPEPGTSADLAKYVRDEIVRFQKLVSAIGLKAE